MTNSDIPTDHLAEDAATAGDAGGADPVETTSGEGVTMGGQLGVLPTETPQDPGAAEDQETVVGDINPSSLNGSADDVEQQVRETGAP